MISGGSKLKFGGWRSAAVLGASSAVLALAACEQQKAPASVDEARLVAADKEPGAWMSHGRTYSEQRYSPLEKINASNVKDVGLAWQFQLSTNRGVEVTPIVVDGVMYVTSAWSPVYALNAKTGELLWKYDPEVPKETGKFACCDVANRGVAVWKGRVYSATLDGRLVALNAKTGRPDWIVKTTPEGMPYTITGAPRIAHGKVFIGNGGSEYGVRGYVSAYDAETGKLDWRFYVTPGDPSKPQENKALEMAVKTWSGDWFKQGGGGGSPWDSMSYDPETNTLMFGTGNGAPWDRVKRSAGKGDNLFLSSIVAVDADTGEYKWHYQTTPGDDWDFDSTQTLIQADLTIDGKPRKVVMQAAKNGFFYVIDRTTGKLINAHNFVTTNWATAIDPVSGRPIESGDPRYTKGVSLVMPSGFGGHNWHPMSFSPKTGLAYIPAQDVPSAYGSDDHYAYKNGEWNVAQNPALNTMPTDKKALAAVKNSLKGKLVAWDPIAGKEAWHVDHKGPWNGGTLATAGGLVFQGTIDGHFNAYDASNGKPLWSQDIYTAALAGPMSYEIDGEQYVAVGAGFGTLFYIIGGFALDQHLGVPENGRILVYKLGGKAVLPKPNLTKIPIPQPPAQTASPSVVAAGQLKYQTYCVYCHGYNAIGAGVIPDLRYSGLLGDSKAFKGVVLGGERKSLGMVSFASVLSDSDADAVRAYLIQEAGRAYADEHPAKAGK